MKITRSFSYALNALIQLASTEIDTPTACSKMAARGEMPERFLLQILRHLVNHGLLTSTRGVVGGYRLARPPAEISLLDIFEALAAATKESSASIDSLPEFAQNKLRAVVSEIDLANAKRLSKVKISEFVISNLANPNKSSNDITATVDTDQATALRPSDI